MVNIGVQKQNTLNTKKRNINKINKNMVVIIFRGRSKEDGCWREGSYVYNTRKGESHNIITRDDNVWHEIYRESLQILNFNNEFVNIESVL